MGYPWADHGGKVRKTPRQKETPAQKRAKAKAQAEAQARVDKAERWKARIDKERARRLQRLGED